MKIVLENLSGLERRLNVTVPAEEIASKVDAKLHKIAVKAKMPGFRPGKVPFDIVKKNYAISAHSDVLENVIQETYAEGIRKEQLNPAGRPEIKIISSNLGEHFEYSATFEVYPEIKLNDFKKIEVEKSVAEIADSDVEEMLEKMRKSHVRWQEISDPAYKTKIGDQLTIDLTVKPHGVDEKVEPKIEKDLKFVLGDGQMWVDFEKPLYDLSVSEEKKYTLTMPATHADQNMSGKEAEFTVKVHKVCAPILPDLNDEFASKMNIKEGGIAKLKEEVRSHMERELEGVIQGLFKRAIMDKLLDQNPIEEPKVLVENELRRQEHGWHQRFAKSGGVVSEKAPPFPRDEFEKHAKRNVALSLLFSNIVKENKLMVTPSEVNKKIEELVSAYYDDKDEMVNKLLSDQRYIAETEALLMEEKVMSFLASQVNVIDKPISYKDAMAQK